MGVLLVFLIFFFPSSVHLMPNQGLSKLREEEKSLAGELKLVTPTRDFTPPQFLTLLFTDLGVLTPSAVSDELIKLYY